MSYNFKVQIKDGAFVAGEAPNAPDGTYLISGHVDEDGANENVGITRSTPEGQTVAQANAWHK